VLHAPHRTPLASYTDPIQPSTPNTDSHDPFGRQLMFASAHEANTVGIATAEAGQVRPCLHLARGRIMKPEGADRPATVGLDDARLHVPPHLLSNM
jgi:hypothetical protein